MFPLCPKTLSPAWQVCLQSLSLLNLLSQKWFFKLFSSSVIAEAKLEAEAVAVAVVSCLVK